MQFLQPAVRNLLPPLDNAVSPLLCVVLQAPPWPPGLELQSLLGSDETLSFQAESPYAAAACALQAWPCQKQRGGCSRSPFADLGWCALYYLDPKHLQEEGLCHAEIGEEP